MNKLRLIELKSCLDSIRELESMSQDEYTNQVIESGIEYESKLERIERLKAIALNASECLLDDAA